MSKITRCCDWCCFKGFDIDEGEVIYYCSKHVVWVLGNNVCSDWFPSKFIVSLYEMPPVVDGDTVRLEFNVKEK
jgi:hypothetical protein